MNDLFSIFVTLSLLSLAAHNVAPLLLHRDYFRLLRAAAGAYVTLYLGIVAQFVFLSAWHDFIDDDKGAWRMPDYKGFVQAVQPSSFALLVLTIMYLCIDIVTDACAWVRVVVVPALSGIDSLYTDHAGSAARKPPVRVGAKSSELEVASSPLSFRD